jgi:hypothetical protein
MVEPAAERISFHTFTMAKAVEQRDLNHRNLILGVDMRWVFFIAIVEKSRCDLRGNSEPLCVNALQQSWLQASMANSLVVP